jgi:quercetin dioxygenase-like cupin family protein
MDATAQATRRHRISRDDGERVSLGGLDIIFKITSDQTGGAFAVCEISLGPGRLIPAHLHDTEDELSYVVDGRIGVLVGEEEFTADAGWWVSKPRGIPHTFWNPGPDHARTIEIHHPRGLRALLPRAQRDLQRRWPTRRRAPHDQGRGLPPSLPPRPRAALMDEHHVRLIGT